MIKNLILNDRFTISEQSKFTHSLIEAKFADKKLTNKVDVILSDTAKFGDLWTTRIQFNRHILSNNKFSAFTAHGQYYIEFKSDLLDKIKTLPYTDKMWQSTLIAFFTAAFSTYKSQVIEVLSDKTGFDGIVINEGDRWISEIVNGIVFSGVN